MLAMLWLTGTVTGVLLRLTHATFVPPNETATSKAAMGIATLLALTIYHSVAEGTGGATLGKWLLGLRVAKDDLTRCSFAAACVRNLGFWLDVFGLGLFGGIAMAASPTKKRVGDKVAGTVVYDISSVRREAPLPRVAPGIALGLVLFGVTEIAALFGFARIG